MFYLLKCIEQFNELAVKNN